MRRHSVLAPLFAVLIILTAFSGAIGPVGSAAAESVEIIAPIWGPTGVHISWGIDGNLTGADKDETKTNLYDKSLMIANEEETHHTVYQNYANDSVTTATTIGQNAYIRALKNNSDLTESQARLRARQAIADYYSQRQLNLIKQWNVTLSAYDDMNRTENIANISDNYIYTIITKDDASSTWFESTSVKSGGSVTLLNGSTVDSIRLVGTIRSNQDGSNPVSYFSENITLGTDRSIHGELGSRIIIEGFNTSSAPGSDMPPVQFMDLSQYYQSWSNIIEAENRAKSRIDNMINLTYTKIQSGEMNISELVIGNPFLAADQYSPSENWGAWSLSMMMSMGYGAPANVSEMSGIGSMTISSGNESYEGLLLSDGLPSNDTFVVGQTYNAGNLTGPQYVLDPVNKRMIELTDNFTITNATIDGRSVDSIGYRDIERDVASTDDFRQRLDAINDLRAEINALQAKLRDSGGGGGLMANNPKTLALIVLGAIIIGVLISREGA